LLLLLCDVIRDKANVDEEEQRKRSGPVKKIQWTAQAADAEAEAAYGGAGAGARGGGEGAAGAGDFQPDPYDGHMTYQEVNKALTTLNIWYRFAEDNGVSP
jgi:hypothetical protein